MLIYVLLYFININESSAYTLTCLSLLLIISVNIERKY